MPGTALIHSVDSLRLLSAIDSQQASDDEQLRQAILLEVNVSGDEAKHGFIPEDTAEAIEAAMACSHIQLRGLMCMAGFGTSPEEARGNFSRLRELRDHLADRYPESDLTELSMGMSGDYEQAIEAGATLVRVGSALFEGLQEWVLAGSATPFRSQPSDGRSRCSL